MRIIVMGTGPFAVPSFQAILESRHDVALVVTRPERVVKSRKAPPPSPVRQWATESRMRMVDPPSINDASAIEELHQIDADLLVVCDYGQILKPAALAATPLGGINLHGSLLPAYRGAAPVQRALLAGESTTGVSVIHMTPGLDAGPVLTTRELQIDDQETAGELEQRLALLGASATVEAVSMLETWDRQAAIGKIQDENLASKAPRLTKQEGEIDWTRPAGEILCHIRGMQPWPVAFTHLQLDEKKPPMRVAVPKASLADLPRPPGVTAGDVLPGDGLLIAAADQVVEIERIRPAGRREMSGSEFLRGHPADQIKVLGQARAN